MVRQQKITLTKSGKLRGRQAKRGKSDTQKRNEVLRNQLRQNRLQFNLPDVRAKEIDVDPFLAIEREKNPTERAKLIAHFGTRPKDFKKAKSDKLKEVERAVESGKRIKSENMARIARLGRNVVGLDISQLGVPRTKPAKLQETSKSERPQRKKVDIRLVEPADPLEEPAKQEKAKKAKEEKTTPEARRARRIRQATAEAAERERLRDVPPPTLPEELLGLTLEDLGGTREQALRKQSGEQARGRARERAQARKRAEREKTPELKPIKTKELKGTALQQARKQFEAMVEELSALKVLTDADIKNIGKEAGFTPKKTKEEFKKLTKEAAQVPLPQDPEEEEEEEGEGGIFTKRNINSLKDLSKTFNIPLTEVVKIGEQHASLKKGFKAAVERDIKIKQGRLKPRKKVEAPPQAQAVPPQAQANAQGIFGDQKMMQNAAGAPFMYKDGSPLEGNAFIGAKMAAEKAGKDTFEVGGKTFQVK